MVASAAPVLVGRRLTRGAHRRTVPLVAVPAGAALLSGVGLLLT
ncbi:hypothetical protein AB0N16_05620 [Streptomyces sp. NPDC051105]